MSFSFLMSIFLKPDLSMCLVFLSCLLPTLGSRTLPLKRLLTAESTPLCFLQDLCTKANTPLDNLTCDRARKVCQPALMSQREQTRFQEATRMRDGWFLTLTRLNSSDWNLLILFVFFLIILVLFKGCTAIILYLIHNRSLNPLLKPFLISFGKFRCSHFSPHLS